MVNESVFTNLKAVLNASKFKAFLNGTQIILHSRKKVFVRVEKIEKVADVPSPFKFSFLTTISGNGHTASGYGSANFKLLALEKSIAEAVERLVYKNVKGTSLGTSNTNGWATNLSVEATARNAVDELLERDAVLVHWLKREPMIELALTSYPIWLRNWLSNEENSKFGFHSVKILYSTLGYLPTITVVMQDEFGYSVMSHATNHKLPMAVCKALTETYRLGQIASTNRFLKSSKSLVEGEIHKSSLAPEDHAMAYAHHLKFPSWIFGKKMSWKDCEVIWNKRSKHFLKNPIEFEFHQVVSSPLVVGYCTSSKVQNLFFGPTSTAEIEGLINFERLFSDNRRGEINLLPHFVA